ncbi:hypothetical protein ACFSFZ_15435 [Mixta tenebrionis]|uniref:Uncharacterized protein n=1 Tax=Mixta tenebrionis TaxID=2562439 RepID=A0A506VCK8_9GAMM|nr:MULTISPECIES: hypothetical protein [Mixta]QHM75506.1 hypothetical protein C7M52_01460 [Mixta theicola]TPW43385.1 hypothetical protein FKM52_07460 [Mixta tenebrionis]
MRTLNDSLCCKVSGAGAIQDMIVSYYENKYGSMFPNNAKALELGKNIGTDIGKTTESQLNQLTSEKLKNTFIKALEKKYAL